MACYQSHVEKKNLITEILICLFVCFQEEPKAVEADSSVVCLSHIPHGFYESQMKKYFAQFGKVNRLRLSRNKKVCIVGSSQNGFTVYLNSTAIEYVSVTITQKLILHKIVLLIVSTFYLF